MRVLFTTSVLEHPAAGGPQLRIENSIKALSRVCDLFIVSRASKDNIGGNDAELFYRQYCKKFVYSPSVIELNKRISIRLLQKIYSMTAGRNNDAKDAKYILDIADNNSIDVIWFGYGNISFPLIKQIKKARPDLNVVCDTDSVWSRFILRELPYETNSIRRLEIERKGKEKEQEEKEWVNLCEITAAVSEIDAEYYRGLAKEPGRIKVFSNVIDLNSYKDTPSPPAGFKKPCMYLAGTFWPQSPMEKAARWVISDVLPIVEKTIPDIHFYIVGKGSKEVLSDISNLNITITGKLPSVLSYLCNADVSLVPLMFESGTRFKILESGACSIPIVSTTLGAEGIPVQDGKELILADKPDEFAEGIVKIIRDKEFGKRLAENCRNLIYKNYSIGSLVQEAKEILSYLQK